MLPKSAESLRDGLLTIVLIGDPGAGTGLSLQHLRGQSPWHLPVLMKEPPDAGTKTCVSPPEPRICYNTQYSNFQNEEDAQEEPKEDVPAAQPVRQPRSVPARRGRGRRQASRERQAQSRDKPRAQGHEPRVANHKPRTPSHTSRPVAHRLRPDARPLRLQLPPVLRLRHLLARHPCRRGRAQAGAAPHPPLALGEGRRPLHDGRYTKVANIVGHAMQYHPHGDASIGDAIVVLARQLA